MSDSKTTTAPKENANPTLHSVDRRRRRRHAQQPLSSRNEDDDDDAFLFDPSIAQALAEIAAARPTAVQLLQQAGWSDHLLPTNKKQQQQRQDDNNSEEYWHRYLEFDNQPMTMPPIATTTAAATSLKHQTTTASTSNTTLGTKDSSSEQPIPPSDLIDALEVFDIIRNIQDPEHPHSLEELGVVTLEQITVQDNDGSSSTTISPKVKPCVEVRFTPTIPHCSMATLIGLCLRVKLLRSLPSRLSITVQIEPGMHASETAINQQLRDKERICAALENPHLLQVVNKCIRDGMRLDSI